MTHGLKIEQKAEIVDALLDSVFDLASFQETMQNDPLLSASQQRRDRLLDAATASVTRSQREELREAISSEKYDCITFGILYGLQLADAIRAVSPADVTSRILDRMRESGLDI